MKKLLAGTFAFGVLMLMGAMTAEAYTVYVDAPTRVTTVSYRTYQPTYYQPVRYSSYSSRWSSSYSVDTVSYISGDFAPNYRYFNTPRTQICY